MHILVLKSYLSKMLTCATPLFCRGRHSIVRRVIEKSSGKEFAAKFTHVREENDKDFFRLELDALLKQSDPRIEKLHDAYETKRQLILVVEMYPTNDMSLYKRISQSQFLSRHQD